MKKKILDIVKKSIGPDNYLRLRRFVTASRSRVRTFFRVRVSSVLKMVRASQPKIKALGRRGLIRVLSPLVDRFFEPNLRPKRFIPGVNLAESNGVPVRSPEIESVKVGSGISVITLNLNGADFLASYLDGLKALPNVPTELVFVDHASSDNSVELVRSFCEENNFALRLVQKLANDTFSKSNNEAIKLCSYDTILFLNNDVVLDHTTQIRKAMRVLSAHPEVGIVGVNLYHDLECTQLQHAGTSFFWDSISNFYRPVNIQSTRISPLDEFDFRIYPAVTAACSLVRKQDVVELGGFHEAYNYGFEDVDLSMEMLFGLGKTSVVLHHSAAFHEENKSQKRDSRLTVMRRRKANQVEFSARQGLRINYLNWKNGLNFGNPFNIRKTRIGFVVTEAGSDATAGDYFTAMELARALSADERVEVEFYPIRGKGNVVGVGSVVEADILVVMIDRFDVSSIKSQSPNTILIAWARNWFDRWMERDHIDAYDYYFASSDKATDYFIERGLDPVSTLRIGTNAELFECAVSDNERDLDIVFIGSRWDVPREIEDSFAVLRKYKSRVIGVGWQQEYPDDSLFGPAIPYSSVPRVYANSKIVIDDAASSTKDWASANSRVFDALAAGCLVISNSQTSSVELAKLPEGSLSIPTYSSPEELEGLLNTYLHDDNLRAELVTSLQREVVRFHTYKNRSEQFLTTIDSYMRSSIRMSIKVPAPNQKVKHLWGDYHYARSLKKEFKKLGYRVRIDLLDEWYCSEAKSDHVVLVLRGLSEYEPEPHQINLMWNISHPNLIKAEEYRKYDIVFSASESHAVRVSKAHPDVNSKALMQCTDSALFHPQSAAPDSDEKADSEELLFVGNSRNVFREIVKHPIELGLPIKIIGSNWEQFIPEALLGEPFIENEKLSGLYGSGRIVLNDHWETMRANGFVSNRLFDAVASGAVVITDQVDGVEALFEENVITYDGSRDGFESAYKRALEVTPSAAVIRKILDNHTFRNRAIEMDQEIRMLPRINSLLDFDVEFKPFLTEKNV